MFKKWLKNKNVLFIPIYSMRNYETGFYNLANDGNMARIVSKLYELENCNIDLLIPAKSENLDKAISILKGRTNIKIIKCNAYGKNAKETREELEKFIPYINENYDCIISEPNILTKYLVDNDYKVIYWCVASITSEICPWFVEDYIEIDKYIASKAITAVSLENQVLALKGNSYVESFYNPEVFDYKTIFFPFRLSDKSYHFEELKKAIYKIKSMGYNNFKVLYTDPNNSYYEKLDDVFVKVSPDKDIYLSILKSRPIVPYLEDPDNMIHISTYELFYYNCKVISLNTNNSIFDKAYKTDIENLFEAIINLLKED